MQHLLYTTTYKSKNIFFEFDPERELNLHMSDGQREAKVGLLCIM